MAYLESQAQRLCYLRVQRHAPGLTEGCRAPAPAGERWFRRCNVVAFVSFLM